MKSNKSTIPFITRYKYFWVAVQSMVFFPFQNIGPFIVAAMPALFTGHSVYTWYATTSTAWLATLISVIVAVAMEAININVVHTALNLFEQKQNGKGILMTFFSILVMVLVSTVIAYGSDDLSTLIKGLAISSPWLTGVIYLAVGMTQTITQEQQKAQLEKEKTEANQKEQESLKARQAYQLELAKLQAKKEREAQKAAEKALEAQRLHELKMAQIERGIAPSTGAVADEEKNLTMKEIEAAILKRLQEDEKLNVTKFSDELGINRRKFYRVINVMQETGQVIKNGNGYELS